MDLQEEREAFERYCFEVLLMSPSDGHFERELEDPEFYESVDTHRLWKLWQAKHQAIPDGFVLVPKEPNKQFKNVLSRYLDELWMGEWGCDWDGFICVNGIDPNEIWQFMIEAQEPAND